eukprot:4017911-Pyramimonas_sp.AAC.1
MASPLLAWGHVATKPDGGPRPQVPQEAPTAALGNLNDSSPAQRASACAPAVPSKPQPQNARSANAPTACRLPAAPLWAACWAWHR